MFLDGRTRPAQPSYPLGLILYTVRATEGTYVLWALHAKVKRWVPLFVGPQQELVAEMIERQDRVRRSREPCRFVVRPEGIMPD